MVPMSRSICQMTFADSATTRIEVSGGWWSRRAESEIPENRMRNSHGRSFYESESFSVQRGVSSSITHLESPDPLPVEAGTTSTRIQAHEAVTPSRSLGGASPVARAECAFSLQLCISVAVLARLLRTDLGESGEPGFASIRFDEKPLPANSGLRSACAPKDTSIMALPICLAG